MLAKYRVQGIGGIVYSVWAFIGVRVGSVRVDVGFRPYDRDSRGP